MRIADRIRGYNYGGGVVLPDAFISVWDTTNTSSGSSNSNQVELPLVDDGTYDFNVDWGDGSNDDITVYNQSEVTHTYSSSGIYTITITGTINGWQFDNSGDKLKIKEILKFDTLNIKDNATFYGCSNLVITAKDELGTAGLTDFYSMFKGCSSLTNIPLFDTSNVTTINYAFQDCTNLTTVPLFDFSGVTQANSSFRGCSSLTNIPLFDFSSLENAYFLFYECSSLTTVPLFDFSNVGNAGSVFRKCTGLTTVPLYDFSTAYRTDSMFKDSTNITSVPLFDLSNVTDAYLMFSGCTLSTASYSAFLEHLDTLSLQSGVSFHGGNSKYNTAGGTARTNIINDHSWTITDGGAE